jgi:2-C-methyl-D-erythritol 4-phosphate cytidylyltransferase
MAEIAIIIPAAGSGSRFAADENKIFQPVAGMPMVLRTLRRFADRNDVCQVLLVVSEKDHSTIEKRLGRELGRLAAQLVVGGPTRAHSVRNALDALDERAELVAVHDAARPAVSDEDITAVFQAAAEHRAAMLACPVTGTLKRVDGRNVITETVPREDLWQAQTPQVFQSELLRRAYAGDIDGVTDDAMLVERLGVDVRVVPGDPRNIKVTTQADLALVEAALPPGRDENVPPGRS